MTIGTRTFGARARLEIRRQSSTTGCKRISESFIMSVFSYANRETADVNAGPRWTAAQQTPLIYVGFRALSVPPSVPMVEKSIEKHSCKDGGERGKRRLTTCGGDGLHDEWKPVPLSFFIHT